MRVRQTLPANECEAVVVKRVTKLWLKESARSKDRSRNSNIKSTKSGNQPFDVYAIKLLSKLLP